MGLSLLILRKYRLDDETIAALGADNEDSG